MENRSDMIIPVPLKQGDVIRIVCPSESAVLEDILPAAEWIRNLGFRVEYGDTLGKISGQFGGTDQERIDDIQKAINDKNVRAIWCARGGYGAIRLLDQIDFSPLLSDPKWVIGFNDITALHSALFQHRIASLHAPMPLNFNNTSDSSIAFGLLLSYLMGNFQTIQWKRSIFDVEGTCQKRIFGGNLSTLYSLRGTKYDLDFKDTILFLEDSNQYLYHIDRICTNFNLGKHFSGVAGLLIGQFIDLKDCSTPFGQNGTEIIKQFAEKENIGIQSFEAPFGNKDYNLPLLLGVNANFTVGKENVTLSYNG